MCGGEVYHVPSAWQAKRPRLALPANLYRVLPASCAPGAVDEAADGPWRFRFGATRIQRPKCRCISIASHCPPPGPGSGRWRAVQAVGPLPPARCIEGDGDSVPAGAVRAMRAARAAPCSRWPSMRVESACMDSAC